MAQRNQIKTVDFPDAESFRIAVLSDTHGRPHPNLFPLLAEHHSSLILHAGDIGGFDLITELSAIGQTVHVRGNTDSSGPSWPDSVFLQIRLGRSFHLTLLLLHFALHRLRLNGEARALLKQHPAQVVVFGHSHIPFLGMEGTVCLFNPGSAGPSRMGLPTTLGIIDISSGRMSFKHLNLQTGEPWTPE